jgi:two-component system sensor histidine kinase ChiS
MWFGTGGGLNKYDGYTFTVYRHDPEDPGSLRDDVITALYEDRAGVLWVGTLGGWLERYDPEHDRFTHTEVAPAVRALYQDSAGTLWVGTDEGGLFRFDRESEEVSSAWYRSGIAALAEDNQGAIWIGSGQGWVGTYASDTGRFRAVISSVREPGVYPVSALYADGAGTLWIGTAGMGLSRLVLGDGKGTGGGTDGITHYLHDPDDPGSLSSNVVTAIHGDPSGVLWVGTEDGGLARFDPGTEQFTHYRHDAGDPYSLSSDYVLSLFRDRAGLLWVGTFDGGLSKLNLVSGGFRHVRHIAGNANSLGDNHVNALFEDHQGVLWVGTLHGLDHFDRNTGAWRHYRNDPDDPHSLSDDRVWSLYEDRMGVLWVGTQTGFDRYDRELDRFEHHPAKPVQAIYEDSRGGLHIVHGNQVDQFDREEERLAPTGSLGVAYTSIRDDGGAWIRLGTAGWGVYNFPELANRWEYWYRHDPDDPGSLSSDWVFTIFEDAAGVFWFGTARGLDRLDKTTDTFTHYRVQDGLANDHVFGILQDRQGTLWLSTGGGLSRFDPRTESWRNYDVSDGLQGNEFNPGAYHQSPSGELFFGGNNGFTAFYPEQITDNPHVPPVVITAFSLFSRIVRTDLPADAQIELNYRDNFVSFDFAALDFVAPGKNQYAYRMEGLDEGWIQAGTRRHADYPNLPPGDYVFRVKASNNDGLWNEDGVALYLTLTPPFWRTAWFWGIVALALGGLAIGGYRLRVRGLQRRSQELEVQVAQRTEELRWEMDQRVAAEEALRQSEAEKAVVDERNRLARDLHDSVTQALYAATLYADASTRLLASGQVDSAADNLRKLRRTAKEALGEMRLLIFELRPPVLEEEGLAGALQTRLETVERRSGLQTDLRVQGDVRPPPDVEEGLYRIALEALNNALKHAQARSVVVSLWLDSESIILEVADDGLGFDPATGGERRGLGLRGMAERAAKLGGALTVDSSPGHGTRVRVHVDLP